MIFPSFVSIPRSLVGSNFNWANLFLIKRDLEENLLEFLFTSKTYLLTTKSID